MVFDYFPFDVHHCSILVRTSHLLGYVPKAPSTLSLPSITERSFSSSAIQTFIDRSAEEIRAQYSGNNPSHWGYANIATTSAYDSSFSPLPKDKVTSCDDAKLLLGKIQSQFQQLHLDETRVMNVSLTGYNIELRRKVSKFEVQGDPSGFVDFYLVWHM